MFTSITMFFISLLLLSTLAFVMVTIANIASGYFNIIAHIRALYIDMFVRYKLTDKITYDTMCIICNDHIDSYYTGRYRRPNMYSIKHQQYKYIVHTVNNHDIYVHTQHSADYIACMQSLKERRDIVKSYVSMY